ncbi:hypothetical protein GGTG_12044 [Gaeumannomyces tritici R3-111a-1]|uniref:Uncharacterized protein n=1 Tax=Gaeumannomyces tritici (strain R3-111a-1) TaxID=644352 RepID=J3PEW5_GAET3|nr:hypothetical protein GGTG_12044 [Gaeumannomyces tritici R3-111a-1]EJT71023.1 hypothetical protein GGTG_12044 [Gaeumannomyces tritici R3-111a-1]
MDYDMDYNMDYDMDQQSTILEEVLRNILARYGTEDVKNAPTSELLTRVMGSPGTRDPAMRWACRAGCMPVIEAAVRHGSSASALAVGSVGSVGKKPVARVGGPAEDPADTEQQPPMVVKALTLQLAAKGGQVEAFERLIALGARVDEPGTSVASVRTLVKLVTRGPDATALLRLMLTGAGAEAQLASQLDQERRDEALLELMRGYVSRGPLAQEYLGFARALLNAGASPNCCRLGLAGTSVSTLSLAVRSRSSDAVQLLVDFGAHVNGCADPKLARRPHLPLHVPLCAAVHAMATTATALDEAERNSLTQTVQLLLHSGADINICAPFRGSALHTDRLTTPLLVFLNAVDSWETSCGGSEALKGLRFLLDSGASPVAPPAETTPGLRDRLSPSRWNWCAPDADVARALLDDWGVRALAIPSFASALQLLVGHRSRCGQFRGTAEALASYDYTPAPAAQEKQKDDDGVLAGWRATLGSAIHPLSASERSDFLYFYAVRKGTCPEHWARLRTHLSQDHSHGDGLARATLAVLLEAGADVNHRAWQQAGEGSGDQQLQQDDGPTALHSICLWLAGRHPSEEDYGRNPMCRGFRHTPGRLEFLRFLVEECGADTGLLHEGRNPVEILEQLTRPDMDGQEAGTLPWQRDGGVVRQARGRFVEFLRGAADR